MKSARKIAAIKYLEYFQSGDVDRMNSLFHPDLEFHGPFIHTTTSTDYLTELRKEPATDCDIRVLQVFESGETVCIHYHFTKPGIETEMVQFFEYEGKLIKKIRLIFDSRVFN